MLRILFIICFSLSLSRTSINNALEKFIVGLDELNYIYNDNEYFQEFLEDNGYMQDWAFQIGSNWEQVVGGSNNNSCINGKDQTKMTPQEQLKEFVKGPCSPFIIVPGLFSTKLTVAIDCEKLQTENPEIFQSCGWNSCSKSGLSKAPDSEYVIWISSFTSPMSLATPKSSICWGNLIKMNYNPGEPNWNQMFTSPAGVNVSVLGADAATLPTSQCGFSAITDLLDDPVQILPTKAWHDFQKAFVSLGYQVGLTLYGAPYDWRKTTLANEISRYLNDTVRQAYNMTGKPVVLISHSLGNFGVYNMLNNMSISDKDLLIAQWISFMNPLAGATMAPPVTIGGDSMFVLEFNFGMSFQAQKLWIENSSTLFDLFPKDTYQRFANEPWMQEWLARQTLENEYNVSTPAGKAKWEQIVKGPYPLEWFPTPLNNCSVGFTERPDDCCLMMFNWSATPNVIINISGTNITYNASTQGLQDLLSTYNSFTPNWEEMLDLSALTGIYLLPNPQVPVSLIYGSHLNTRQGAYFDYDPGLNVENGEYAFPTDYIHCAGDNTVPIASALIPGIKWIWEYQNGFPGSKPLKILEYCSIYNQLGTPYDVINPNTPYAIKNVSYIGLDCDCLTGTNQKPVVGNNCQHSDAPSDTKVLQFAINVAFTNIRPSNFEAIGAFKLTSDQLINVSLSCPTVVPGSQVYWNYINGNGQKPTAQA